MMEVLAEQCETCIFRPGNQMALRRGRVAGMVRECARQQSFIPCHETMVYEDDDEFGEASATGPMCRGFYDAHGELSQLLRIAERLNAVRFVDYQTGQD
jgi:hypothetical protein